MRTFFTALLLLLSLDSHAFHVGFGGQATMPLSQQETDGSRNLFNLSPLIYLAHAYNLRGSSFIVPKLGMVYHLGTGSNYSKMTLITNFDYVYMLSSTLLLHAGAGTHIIRIYGDGNAVTVNNGAGYATAYQPSDTSVSYTLVFNIGAELVLHQEWSLQLDLQSFGLTGEDFGYSLSFNYFL